MDEPRAREDRPDEDPQAGAAQDAGEDRRIAAGDGPIGPAQLARKDDVARLEALVESAREAGDDDRAVVVFNQRSGLAGARRADAELLDARPGRAAAHSARLDPHRCQYRDAHRV